MVFGIDDVRGSKWKATALDPLAQGSADSSFLDNISRYIRLPFLQVMLARRIDSLGNCRYSIGTSGV
jgi:hypothetical protein